MKKLTRILALTLCCLLAAGLAACGETPAPDPDPDPNPNPNIYRLCACFEFSGNLASRAVSTLRLDIVRCLCCASCGFLACKCLFTYDRLRPNQSRSSKTTIIGNARDRPEGDRAR